MRRFQIVIPAAAIALTGLFAAVDARADTALTPGAPIVLPGPAGHFDYMTFDAANDRVYASHPGAKSLSMLDLTTGDATEVPLGAEVNGVAADPKHNRFFTAGGGQKLFILDGKTLATQKEIDLSGPGDGIFYDSANDLLYVDNDDSTNIWVYDPEQASLVRTITIAGAPESSVFVASDDRLYQNIKPANEIQEIDTQSGAILATWPVAPTSSPHGLVMDPVSHCLYCAGKNSMLSVVDTRTGNVVDSLQLASATDQIAFDPKLRRIYAPGGGSMTVLQLDKSGTPTVIDTLTIPKTAHTICIDPKSHTVWICYFDTDHSYFQPFTPGSK